MIRYIHITGGFNPLFRVDKSCKSLIWSATSRAKNSRETTQTCREEKHTTCDFQNACAKENKHVSNHLDHWLFGIYFFKASIFLGCFLTSIWSCYISARLVGGLFQVKGENVDPKKCEKSPVRQSAKGLACEFWVSFFDVWKKLEKRSSPKLVVNIWWVKILVIDLTMGSKSVTKTTNSTNPSPLKVEWESYNSKVLCWDLLLGFLMRTEVGES